MGRERERLRGGGEEGIKPPAVTLTLGQSLTFDLRRTV